MPRSANYCASRDRSATAEPLFCITSYFLHIISHYIVPLILYGQCTFLLFKAVYLQLLLFDNGN